MLTPSPHRLLQFLGKGSSEHRPEPQITDSDPSPLGGEKIEWSAVRQRRAVLSAGLQRALCLYEPDVLQEGANGKILLVQGGYSV